MSYISSPTRLRVHHRGEDVGVAERRRAIGVWGRLGEWAGCQERLAIRVDRRAVGRIADIDVDPDAELPRCRRIVVVAEELIDQRVRARSPGIPSRTLERRGPPDRRPARTRRG